MNNNGTTTTYAVSVLDRTGHVSQYVVGTREDAENKVARLAARGTFAQVVKVTDLFRK